MVVMEVVPEPEAVRVAVALPLASTLPCAYVNGDRATKHKVRRVNREGIFAIECC